MLCPLGPCFGNAEADAVSEEKNKYKYWWTIAHVEYYNRPLLIIANRKNFVTVAYVIGTFSRHRALSVVIKNNVNYEERKAACLLFVNVGAL